MTVRSLGKLSSAVSRKATTTQPVTGFQVSILSFEAQVDCIIQWAQARLSKVVCVCNVHMLMEGHWHMEFAEVLKRADMLTPDGMPLVWMTALMKGKPQDRVAGMELMMSLCEKAQAKQVSIFLFGSTPEMLLKIQRKMFQNYPQLAVVGMISPPFRPLTAAEDSRVVKEINRSGAGLVFVSLGCPKQEAWMDAHHDRVQATMVGLGGSFAVYAEDLRWAPPLVRKCGMEWCYRLVQEPRRLWQRYAGTMPPFVWLAAKQIIKVKLGIDLDRSR